MDTTLHRPSVLVGRVQQARWDVEKAIALSRSRTVRRGVKAGRLLSAGGPRRLGGVARRGTSVDGQVGSQKRRGAHAIRVAMASGAAGAAAMYMLDPKQGAKRRRKAFRRIRSQLGATSDGLS